MKPFNSSVLGCLAVVVPERLLVAAEADLWAGTGWFAWETAEDVHKSATTNATTEVMVFLKSTPR
jgi:hypothetical protein